MRVSWKLKFIQVTVTTHIVHWKGKVCLCNCVSISKTALALLGGQGQEYPQASPSGQWGRRWGLSGISHIAKFPSSLPALCNWNKEAQDWEKSWGWAVFLWVLETVGEEQRKRLGRAAWGGKLPLQDSGLCDHPVIPCIQSSAWSVLNLLRNGFS